MTSVSSQTPIAVVALLRGEAVGDLVQHSMKVEHTAAGYLMFARDRWLTVMEDKTLLDDDNGMDQGAWALIGPDAGRDPIVVAYERTVFRLASAWKRAGQKTRRECSEKAVVESRSCVRQMLTCLNMPHPFVPDLTPQQVDSLLCDLEQDLCCWCMEEYGFDVLSGKGDGPPPEEDLPSQEDVQTADAAAAAANLAEAMREEHGVSDRRRGEARMVGRVVWM